MALSGGATLSDASVSRQNLLVGFSMLRHDTARFSSKDPETKVLPAEAT